VYGKKSKPGHCLGLKERHHGGRPAVRRTRAAVGSSGIETAMQIDQTNLSIIRQLRDGRKSYKTIAEKLGISENTVRSRVQRMTDAGLLEISGLVDPDSLDGHRAVLVGVKLKTTDLVVKGAEFSRLRGVVSVSVVTGRFDLFLVVLLKPGFDLLEFFTKEVSKVENVLSTETYVVYKNFNLKIPYML
jgi:Lrp/AsnC family transcriptional regulator, regulator for asnA, asnC and gidA